MRHIYQLVALVLTCQATTGNAFLGDRWLRMYSCENESDSRVCRTCRPSTSPDMKVKFVVDQRKSTVIAQYREDTTTHPPSRFDNCVVIDEKNWSCASKSEFNWNADGMASGVYSMKRVFLNRGEIFYTAFSCAK